MRRLCAGSAGPGKERELIFQRIESEGLAHWSYILGSGNTAVVVDPRRDFGVYVDIARRAGMRIGHVLETHRNEDYVIGSTALAAATGARIWHADRELEYAYGDAVEDGQTWKVGEFRVEAMLTPGHTPGSMSYLVRDPDGNPWLCFTGDALFAGDTGRTDLMGMDRAREMAGMLYDSIFGRLLPLGDGVIACPAHGSGSVCGSGISERLWTTMGLEREHNPMLRHTEREAFVEAAAVELERPPYFREMERLNLQGAPSVEPLPLPPALSPAEFEDAAEGAFVLDTRMELAFGSAHVPGAQSIWKGGLASFAGWHLPYDRPLLLVTEAEDPMDVVRILVRLGYDRFAGTLAGGMLSWHTSGRDSASMETLTVQQLCGKLDANEHLQVLDVRSDEERESAGSIPDALNIHLTMLPERADEVPDDRLVLLFCGSGLRSMAAASYLARRGHDNLGVVLGGLSGWTSGSCQLEL